MFVEIGKNMDIGLLCMISCAWSRRVTARARCIVERHLGICHQDRQFRPQKNKKDLRSSQLSVWPRLASPSHQDFPWRSLLLVLRVHPMHV